MTLFRRFFLVLSLVLPLLTTPLAAQILRAQAVRKFPLTAEGREIAFSPDSTIVATSSVDGAIGLWRVADGRLIRTLTHPQGATSIDFSHDGKMLVSGGYDRHVRVWRVGDGALLRTLPGHAGTVWGVAFAPDGKRIASSGEDKVARIWRLSDGAQILALRGHTLNIWCVAYSPDGKLIGTSSFDRTAKLWRSDSGALIRTFARHDQAVVALAFHPNGRLVATAGDDSSIRIWRIRDGAVVRTIDAGNHVYSLAFDPRGEWLASGGRAKGALGTFWNQLFGPIENHGTSVRLWRVRDGALQQGLDAHADNVWCVAISPDGRWVATSSLDRTAILWSLRTQPHR